MATEGEEQLDEREGRAVAQQWLGQLIEAQRRCLEPSEQRIVAAVNRRIDRGSFLWPMARKIAAVIMIGLPAFFVIKAVVAGPYEGSIQGLEAANAELGRRLSNLANDIKSLGLSSVVGLDDLGTFTVSGTERNRIAFGGNYNPQFIKEVRYRLGVEPAGELSTLAPSELTTDSLSGRVRFRKESPDLRLNNESIVAELEFVAKPEMVEQFPEYFTLDRLRYRRNFYLGKGGIEADVLLAAITAPRNGATVSREMELDGQIKVKGAWPVVCIKSDQLGDRWWVQDPPPGGITDQGQFRCRVRFGTPGTPAGTKFYATILVARNKEEAMTKFPIDKQFAILPAGYPKSHTITVTRGE